MSRRAISARIVGRDQELEDLDSAVRSDKPDRLVVLVSGEAGIGKTRLVAEAMARLATPPAEDLASWQVVRGTCLKLGEGEMPYAPVLEVLDDLRVRRPSQRLDAIRVSIAGGAAVAGRGAQARNIRFVEIRDAFIEAASAQPMVVVIDDLHWADRSTLDLLLFLSRHLRGGRVVLVLAYRSDELHRRHPLRPVLAELSRDAVREQIALGPMSAEAVIEQVRQLGALEDRQVRRVVERAVGNPLHVEELVALGDDHGPLPDSVRDVLLARVGALDPATIRVLGALAVLGRDGDVRLLERVLELDTEVITRSLGAGVDHSILAADSTGTNYRFRHPLLEEAVHDDLLPPDRVELHRRVADALLATGRAPDSSAGSPRELARHLDLGGRPMAAIDAYLDAASVAYRALAWSESVASYERAAELAGKLPSLDQDTFEARLSEPVPQIALATSWSGSPTRSIALLRHWIARAEAAGDRGRAASLWMVLGRIYGDLGEETGFRESATAAAALMPPDPTTSLGVEILIDLGQLAWIESRYLESLRYQALAIEGAARLEHPTLLFRALVHQAETRIALGDVDGGMADVERAEELERIHGWLDLHGALPVNIADALTDAGYLDLAMIYRRRALQMGRDLELGPAWDVFSFAGLAWLSFAMGDWAEAARYIEACRALQPTGLPAFGIELDAAAIAAAGGDFAGAHAALEAAALNPVEIPGELAASLELARARVAEAEGHAAAQLEHLEAGLRQLEQSEGYFTRSVLAAEAASAAADVVAGLRPRRDHDRIEDAKRRAQAAANLAVAIDDGRVVPGSRSCPLTRVNAALAVAEAARAHGHDDPAAWPPIVDAYREIGMRPRAASVAFRSAAAALAAGDHVAGAAALRSAAEAARAIGMHVLLGRIEALGRAARVDVSTDVTVPSPERDSAAERQRKGATSWGLSERELEVLALLGEGRTNGEIGAILFISPKTASVHVTHILDKLGVSSRTEAALLAQQAGAINAGSR